MAQTLRKCFNCCFPAFLSASGSVPEVEYYISTQNCKDVRMSVGADGGKLKSFQVAKGHQKK